jgi:hypothetical protein
MALCSVIRFVSDTIYDRAINNCTPNWQCQQYLTIIT